MTILAVAQPGKRANPLPGGLQRPPILALPPPWSIYWKPTASRRACDASNSSCP